MAEYTEQELAVFSAAVASLPSAANNLLATKTPAETANAISTLILRSRTDTAVTSVSSFLNLSISNWAALEALETMLPAGTLYEDLKAAKTAFSAHDATELGPRLITIYLAACKHFGI